MDLQLKLCCFSVDEDDFCWPCWVRQASEWDPSYLEEE